MAPSSTRIDGSQLTGRAREVYVEEMFDRIAGPYDRLNRLISLGRDKRWREIAVRMGGVEPGSRVLDLGCGTGDFSLAAARALRGRGEVAGIDLSESMLAVAREKARRAGLDCVGFRHGNAAATGEPPSSADVVLMGWVLRNVGDREAVYAEVRRVLRPGGRFVVLESSRPASAVVRAGFNAYMRVVVPVLVRLVSADRSAYRYLADSSERFLTAAELDRELVAAGFKSVRHRLLMTGTMAIHLSVR